MVAARVDLEAVERKLLADIEDAQPLQKGPRSRAARMRLRAVEQMWIDMRTSKEIVTDISKAYNVDPRTVYEDLRKVEEHYWLADQLDAKNRKIQLRAQWQDQRREARQAGDRKTAAFITDRLCRMEGAYAPIRTENVNINVTANVAIDDVLEALSPQGVETLLELVRQYEVHASRKVIEVAAEETRDPDGPKQLTEATANDTQA